MKIVTTLKIVIIFLFGVAMCVVNAYPFYVLSQLWAYTVNRLLIIPWWAWLPMPFIPFFLPRHGVGRLWFALYVLILPVPIMKYFGVGVDSQLIGIITLCLFTLAFVSLSIKMAYDT